MSVYSEMSEVIGEGTKEMLGSIWRAEQREALFISDASSFPGSKSSITAIGDPKAVMKLGKELGAPKGMEGLFVDMVNYVKKNKGKID